MGNKIGWILAGVLVAGLLVFVLIQTLGSSVSEPTAATASPGFMELKQPASPVKPIFGFEPTEPGNAADDYKAALDIYKAHKKAIEACVERLAEIADNRFFPPTEAMTALEKMNEHLAAGARKKDMKYTTVYTPKELQVKISFPPAADLWSVGNSMFVLANRCYAAKKYADMEKALSGQFFLGWHMTNERSRAQMGLQGVLIQRASLDTVVDLFTIWDGEAHAANAKAAQQYSKELNAILEFNKLKWEALWNSRPQPGDIFKIVNKEQDRAWKVDALLCLGVVRFTHANNPADVKAATKLIEQHVASSDPLEAAAATAARDLTQEGFNQLMR